MHKAELKNKGDFNERWIRPSWRRVSTPRLSSFQKNPRNAHVDTDCTRAHQRVFGKGLAPDEQFVRNICADCRGFCCAAAFAYFASRMMTSQNSKVLPHDSEGRQY